LTFFCKRPLKDGLKVVHVVNKMPAKFKAVFRFLNVTDIAPLSLY
jgi:hypothetical protein